MSKTIFTMTCFNEKILKITIYKVLNIDIKFQIIKTKYSNQNKRKNLLFIKNNKDLYTKIIEKKLNRFRY